MELTEEDRKPIIPSDDIPEDKCSLTSPLAGVCKLKHSRYEDVWPEDVHAAFMEAVALYPPMGKRRLKYYRVSTRENEHCSVDANRAKSFGRCQLIQSYILEKTGKNRSRKQVSSHLQRLKKIFKDNPAMQLLFSECSQPPSEHCSAVQGTTSGDNSTNLSAGTCHLKSDLDPAVNLQNTDTGVVSSSTFSYNTEASSLDNGGPYHVLNSSTSFHDQPSFSSPQVFLSSVPQQYIAVVPPSSDRDYLSEPQDAPLLKAMVNEGFRTGSAFNTSAFSTSLPRFTSKLPQAIQGRLVDSSPTTHFSHTVHSLGFQPTHQWISHDSRMDDISSYYSRPLISAQEAFHTPFLPLQLIPSEKRLYSGLASDWLWPNSPDLSFDPRESSFAELRIRYPPMMCHNSTYPEMRLNTPGLNSSPSESGVSRLPRRISHSYEVTNPATVSDNVPNESAIEFPKQSPESPEDLASPFVIRPTPIYPVSYIHSDIHPKICSDSLTPAPGFSP